VKRFIGIKIKIKRNAIIIKCLLENEENSRCSFEENISIEVERFPLDFMVWNSGDFTE
jgi:hypothetical protein